MDARMTPASHRVRRAIIERRSDAPRRLQLAAHAAAIARHSRSGWGIDKSERSTNLDAIIAYPWRSTAPSSARSRSGASADAIRLPETPPPSTSPRTRAYARLASSNRRAGTGRTKVSRSKYLFVAVTASALALAAVPASAAVAVKTTRVTVNSAGVLGNARPGDSSNLPVSISATGRFVAFSSAHPNLVEGDGNYFDDVFVRDRVRGETTRVSVGPAGAVPNSDSAFPSISANGRFVAFLSLASNLVRGDTNHRADVFVHDRKRGETTRVGVSSTGAEANDGSIWLPAISDNGRVVAFFSRSTNLVPNDHNGIADFFVRDRKRGVTTRVRESDVNRGLYSGIPSISDNGRFVAFESPAPDLVKGDRNHAVDVFLRDRKRGKTTLLSVSSEGEQGNDESSFPAISANGHFVAFSSLASNLVGDDRHNTADTFVRGPLRPYGRP
jgi:hypothetical protein